MRVRFNIFQRKMVKTRLWAIALMVLCTALTSSAQIFYKFGSKKLSLSLLSIITNYNILIGLVLYALGAVLLIIALKGGEVSVLYPIIATSYIWVSILSPLFFPNDSMNAFKWIGVFIIFTGVVLVSLGSKEEEAITYTEAI